MKANPGKYHLLLSTKITEVVFIDQMQITSTTAETFSSITIDSELNFESHLSTKKSFKGDQKCCYVCP